MWMIGRFQLLCDQTNYAVDGDFFFYDDENKCKIMALPVWMSYKKEKKRKIMTFDA